MKGPVKLLVLYRRMAGYFYDCLKNFAEKEKAEIAILCTPASEDAPFSFEPVEGITFYSDQATQAKELYESFDPNLVLCSGWSNRTYLQICKQHVSKGRPAVLAIDNHWNNTFTQQLKLALGRPIIQRSFSHIWIPGYAQYYFARKLGFQPAQIIKGLYCGNPLYKKVVPDSSSNTLLFVGRLVPYKRPDLLMNTFQALVSLPEFSGWKLKLIGNGPLLDQLKAKADPSIELLPFSSPEELSTHFQTAAALCLPSAGEHWGVVVHEAATAGLPLILSDSVGAGEDLLVHQYNGLFFKTDSAASLKESLIQFMRLNQEKRVSMIQASRQISEKINQDQWTASLAGLIQSK